MKELLKDAQEKKFDVVLVWKISRLSRNLKYLLNIVDTLNSLGISFISQSETFNTATPAGIMTLQILGSIAEFERNTIVENIKLALQEKARRGEWLGGKVFGYKNIDKKLIVNKAQAEIIKQIFHNFHNGMTIQQLVKFLNDKNYKTSRNRDFTRSSVYRILTNPIYCGYLRHNMKNKNKYYEIKGMHQPIISKELFKSVQKKIKRTKQKICTDEFILSGLLRCPKCNGSLIRYRTSKYRYYRCSVYHNYGKHACEGFLINADYIEEEVLKKIKNVCENADVQRNLYDTFGVYEVFKPNFTINLCRIEKKLKKSILRHLVSKITLTKDKRIDKIFFNNVC